VRDECDRLSLQATEFEGKWLRVSAALVESNGSTKLLTTDVLDLSARLSEAQRRHDKAREDEASFRQDTNAAEVTYRKDIALWQRCSQQAEQQLTAAQAELHCALSEGRQAVLWASSLDTELTLARAEAQALRADGEQCRSEGRQARQEFVESRQALEERLDALQRRLAGETTARQEIVESRQALEARLDALQRSRADETKARLRSEDKVRRMRASFSWRVSVPLRFLRRYLLDPLRDNEGR